MGFEKLAEFKSQFYVLLRTNTTNQPNPPSGCDSGSEERGSTISSTGASVLMRLSVGGTATTGSTLFDSAGKLEDEMGDFDEPLFEDVILEENKKKLCV